MRYSDVGNALRLANLCGQDIIYCRQSDEYYVWDGTRWVRDLNSSNGIFVKGERVPAAAVEASLIFRLGIQGPFVSLRVDPLPPAPAAFRRAWVKPTARRPSS